MGEAAQEIDWIEPAKRVFDPDAGIYGRWFVGGVCNTCWNAVDRHVRQGRGEQPAIIYNSPLAGQKCTLTYRALQVETQVLAVILRSFDVEKGDRVSALYADGARGGDRHALSLRRSISCRASAIRPQDLLPSRSCSLLRSWGDSPAALGASMALLAVPWTIKPVFGLLSDFVPLFGSRRRNDLLLANGVAAASLLLLAFIPLAPGSRWLLFALLLPTTMAIALGDVIVDVLMVEKGQPLGLTGRFQSIQWTAANTALLLTGVLGGYIAEERLQSLRLCSLRRVVAVCLRGGVALRR